MKGGLPKRFLNNIQERPENLTGRAGSEKYNDLATTLNNMEATKSIVFDIGEMVGQFGKNWKVSIMRNMRLRNVKVRIATQDNKVHVWATKV